MDLIDTHAHLYLPQFDTDRTEVVRRAFDSGVRKIFLPNIDTDTLEPMFALCREFPEAVFPMVGLHPSSVTDNYREALNALELLIIEKHAIAIGETGIDLYWDQSRKKEQIQVFRTQVDWSLKYRLPIVIHARESFEEIFDVLNSFKNQPLKGVFHSFTGNSTQLQQALSLGFHIGIGGIVTFKNASLKDVVVQIPPDRLLLETDAPYLSPEPKRGKRNESAYLVHTCAFLAPLFGKSPEELAALTTENALKLFHHATRA